MYLGHQSLQGVGLRVERDLQSWLPGPTAPSCSPGRALTLATASRCFSTNVSSPVRMDKVLLSFFWFGKALWGQFPSAGLKPAGPGTPSHSRLCKSPIASTSEKSCLQPLDVPEKVKYKFPALTTILIWCVLLFVYMISLEHEMVIFHLNRHHLEVLNPQVCHELVCIGFSSSLPVFPSSLQTLRP